MEMEKWTQERDDLLRRLWLEKKDTGAPKYDAITIAKEMGGFAHCNDGGKSAILGRVGRHRRKAALAKDEAEVKIWSRGKGSGGGRPRTKPPKDPNAPKKPRGRPPGNGSNPRHRSARKQREEAQKQARERLEDRINSVVVKPVEWPTDDEVTAEWRRQLGLPAKPKAA